MHSYALIISYLLVLFLLIWGAYTTMQAFNDRYWSYALVTLAYALAAAGAAVLLSHDVFFFLTLLAYGVFAGGVALLFLLAYFAREKFKLLSRLQLALAIITIGIAIDAFVIEPRWLEINHFTIASKKINKPITIAVVADLQTDHVGNFERKVLKRVLKEKPDMIIMPGDYIQCLKLHALKTQRGRLHNLLKELEFSAPLGVYAVQGNVDRGNWTSIFKTLPVKTFHDTGSTELENFRITGLSFNDSFNRQFQTEDSAKFHIVFGHGPDFALGKPDADLLIAGHTHGGQVQIPMVGPLVIFSAVPSAWGKGGLTRIDEDTTLVVSRGIGMERAYAPRLRFLCHPELIFLHLVPAG